MKIYYLNYELGTVYPIDVRLPNKKEKKTGFEYNDRIITPDFVALVSDTCLGGVKKGQLLAIEANQIRKEENTAISTLIYELIKEQTKNLNRLLRATSLIS